MDSLYELLADLTAFFHGVISVYFLSSIFLFKLKKFQQWYRLSLIPAVIIQWFYLITEGTCPLVLVENYFRKMAGLTVYRSGFISYYSNDFFGINISDSIVSALIGFITAIIIINLAYKYFSKKEDVNSSEQKKLV